MTVAIFLQAIVATLKPSRLMSMMRRLKHRSTAHDIQRATSPRRFFC